MILVIVEISIMTFSNGANSDKIEKEKRLFANEIYVSALAIAYMILRRPSLTLILKQKKNAALEWASKIRASLLLLDDFVSVDDAIFAATGVLCGELLD